MTRNGFAMGMVLLTAAIAQARLEITKVQACYGPFGPERKLLVVYPHDELIFRFVVTGVRTDAENRTDGLLSLKLHDADGKLLGVQDTPLKSQVNLGGDAIPTQARFNLGDKLPAGDYSLTITYTDKISSEKATFQRKFTSKPSEFALVAPDFSYDLDGKLPAPAGGVVGQLLHFRIRAIGLDRTQEKISASMALQVFDAQGKEELAKPLTAAFKNDDAEVVKQIPVVNFRSQLLLNRPGDFVIRVTVTDQIAKKTAKFELPLHVTAP